MNKRNTFKTGFAICAILLVLGAAAGAAAATLLPPQIVESLAVRGAEGAFGTRFFASLISVGKFHAAALFFAFSMLGAAAIPAISAVRGFLLSFAMTSLVRFCGSAAVLPTLGLFAPELLFAIPCLLAISAVSFEASLKLAKRANPYDAKFAKCALATLGVVIIAALADAALSPSMLSAISAYFPT